jgi:hypothetical protein
MKPSSKPPLPRRQFLQQLLILGGTTGAGAFALESRQLYAIPTRVTRAPTATPTASKGYHLTAHIRTYYEKAQLI